MASRQYPFHPWWFLLLFLAVSPAWTLEIEPVLDDQYLAKLDQMIDSAQTSLDIVAFEFLTENGEMKRLAGKLIDRVKVNPAFKVRVFLEGDKDGLGERNRQTADWFNANGIQAFLDSTDCTTHTKAVCADHQTLLVGSTNLSNTSVRRNNEANVLIRSPEIGAGFESYFQTILSDQVATQSYTEPTGAVTLVPDAAYFPALLETIRTASSSLDIIMYYCAFSDKRRNEVWDILEALGERAKAGVRVRVIFDQSVKFSRHITWANLRAAGYLRQQGVTEVYFDDPDKFSHAKVVVKDGREVLLGSTNWYVSDFNRNHQLNVLIRQPEAGRLFQDYIVRKISEECREPHSSFAGRKD